MAEGDDVRASLEAAAASIRALAAAGADPETPAPAQVCSSRLCSGPSKFDQMHELSSLDTARLDLKTQDTGARSFAELSYVRVL